LAGNPCLSRRLSMSAASVRTSGRRDSLSVLPKAAGNKGEAWLVAEVGRFEVLAQELFQLVVDRELFPQ
jgi:hypothetical protein